MDLKLSLSKRANWVLCGLLLSFLVHPAALAEEDPFPGVAVGSEIPGTRITSDPGVSQSDWEATSTYQGFSCPSGSGRGIGIDIGAKQWFAYCVKQWQPQATVDAWAEYRTQLEDAKAAAEAESRAWNAANPGKQKCVQWGPLKDPNGGESSGGVCANPVEPGPGTTVPTEDATPVTVDESNTSEPSPTPISTPEPTSNSSQFTEDTSYQGSGYPFTKIYRGQLSTQDCPIGYHGANGLIAAIGIGTFTECWPENAWAAYRLGGEFWESFKSSGGTYDILSEVRRRENVETIKREASRVAQSAADQTPGIQRCSRWTGYGETGLECAYSFISPTETRTVSETGTTTTPLPSNELQTSLVSEVETSVVDSTQSALTEVETPSVVVIPLAQDSDTNEESTTVTNEMETQGDSNPLSNTEEPTQLFWVFSRPGLERRPL